MRIWQYRCKAAEGKETREIKETAKYFLRSYVTALSTQIPSRCLHFSNPWDDIIIRANSTTLCWKKKKQNIRKHWDVCLTVATMNWILPNSCIPLPNLIFRYCDRQTGEVITQLTISACIPHPLSPLIFGPGAFRHSASLILNFSLQCFCQKY